SVLGEEVNTLGDRIGFQDDIVPRLGRERRTIVLQPEGARKACGQRRKISLDETVLTADAALLRHEFLARPSGDNEYCSLGEIWCPAVLDCKRHPALVPS